MRRIRSAVCRSVLLLVFVAASAPAQMMPFERNEDADQASRAPNDPLGRSTPRDSFVAFMRAAERDDFATASRYMQATQGQRRELEALARDLKVLVDRYFSQALTTISDSPDGALNDGLAADRERIGPLLIAGRNVDLELIRVNDPQVGAVWLIAPETLALVPGLRQSMDKSFIERTMPAALLERKLLGISMAQWIVFAASLLVPFILLACLAGICIGIARRIVDDPLRRASIDAWYADIRWPAIATLTLAIQLMTIPSLGFPVTFRVAYARVAFLAFVIALAWFLRRVLALAFAEARSFTVGKHRASTRSLMLLGERISKALVLVAALVAILLILGVESKTALAAFGIVGVALALGAQRTVENLLGGVFMLSDRAIAVGDLCSISNRLGWIEDITLRSVRIRTLDNSVVSVPAGVLAQEGIENFATREKILAQSILRLQHGTRADQLRRILDRVRRLLQSHSQIESETARIRLVNFSPEAIELELFAYVLTADVPEFLEIREGLLLEIASLIEAEGSGFAQPTQFIYMDETPRADALARAVVAPEAEARNETRAAHLLRGKEDSSEVLAANR